MKFVLSPLSFYQVNSFQARRLFEKAIELADLGETDTAVDLYCGAGAIGLIAAKNKKISAFSVWKLFPRRWKTPN